MRVEDLRILVVDDNANIRRLITTILRSVNIKEVRDAASGAEALEIMKSAPIDLVLSDYVMEGMNGAELTKRIRDEIDHDDTRVPIIIVTGYSEVARLNDAKLAGVNDFLAKPFTTKTLLQRITRAATANLTLQEMEDLARMRHGQTGDRAKGVG